MNVYDRKTKQLQTQKLRSSKRLRREEAIRHSDQETEGAPPVTKFKQIEKYYSGKSLTNLQSALALLEQGLADKRWPKGASRKVPAALNKLSGASKAIATLARKIEKTYEYEFKDGIRGSTDCGPRGHWNSIYFGIYFGSGVAEMEKAVSFLQKRLGAKMTNDERRVVDFAVQFAADFKPVYEAIIYLGTLRPAPVYVMGGTLSATVTKTVQEWGLNPTTVRMPDIRWEEIDYVDEKGTKLKKMIGTILWPKGTKHHTSRFAPHKVNGYYSQCEACGHAIKNNFNWVPLLIDNPDGVPHSFWTGRDCASNLFGVEMEGEAEYSNRIEKP